MSRSRWAITRGQSVCDALEVDLALTPRRLSHRDDVDVAVLFRMNDRHDDLVEKPQRDEPPLAVCESVVLVGVRDTLDDTLRVAEVQPVLLQVPSSLGLSHVIIRGVYIRFAPPSTDGSAGL